MLAPFPAQSEWQCDHRRHGFDRVLAHSGFIREHYRISPIQNRIRHIRNFSASRGCEPCCPTSVAVITGMPNRFAVAISRFCKMGTSSAGSSTPKSPLATMTPSHNARIASICSIASCFSILAITGTCFPALEIKSLISSTSCGLRTKESYPVHALIKTKHKILAVFVGHCLNR